MYVVLSSNYSTTSSKYISSHSLHTHVGWTEPLVGSNMDHVVSCRSYLRRKQVRCNSSSSSSSGYSREDDAAIPNKWLYTYKPQRLAIALVSLPPKSIVVVVVVVLRSSSRSPPLLLLRRSYYHSFFTSAFSLLPLLRHLLLHCPYFLGLHFYIHRQSDGALRAIAGRQRLPRPAAARITWAADTVPSAVKRNYYSVD